MSIKLAAALLLCLFQLKAGAQFLKVITPESLVLQYAGSTGFGSFGGGYDLFKGRGSFDLLYGFVPRTKGGQLNIASGKLAYRPFTVRLSKSAVLYPANPGLFLTYNFGRAFSFEWESPQYSKGYYWWSQSLRTHLSLSTELRVGREHPFAGVRQLALYNEFNTNDLYAVSWWQNRKTLSFFDIVKMGIGARVYF